MMDYIEAREAEGAPRTAFGDMQAALRFFEEAGERPEALRLHDSPALTNAVKEATAAAAERAAGQPGRRGRQAPPLLVAQLAAMETAVVNEKLPKFIRMYAWYRLFRHWTSMRWHDTLGVRPDKLQVRSRGVFGRLERSKTSGPGKRMATLPIFVSFQAWIVKDSWLMTGMNLFDEVANFPRDYLLPLPREDLDGVIHRKAEYTDAIGFSRKLLMRLESPDGKALHLAGAGSAAFWTEHSDRAGLSSWTAALGAPTEQRSFLGRWATAASADGYVRTAVKIVESLQVTAAAHAQVMYAGGADFFDEEHTLLELRDFMTTGKVTPLLASFQLNLLKVADPTILVKSTAQFIAPIARPPAPTAPASSAVDGRLIEEDMIGFAPSDEDNAIEASDLEVAVNAHETDDCHPSSGFVVAIVDRGKRRCLHFVGSCGKVPGEHYRLYECYGANMPDSADIDAKCKVCFPVDILPQSVADAKRRRAMKGGLPDVSSDSDDGSSESESSGRT